MTDKARLATGSLHALTVCYLGLGVYFAPTFLEAMQQGITFLPALSLAILIIVVIAFQVIAWGIRRRRYWAWVAGLCTFGVFVPTPLLPAGIAGLVGLLDSSIRSEFGIRVSPKSS